MHEGALLLAPCYNEDLGDLENYLDIISGFLLCKGETQRKIKSWDQEITLL